MATGIAVTAVAATRAGVRRAVAASADAVGRRAVAASAASAGAVTGRACAPARQWVKTPDQANMALKAMTSNSARLIVAVTKSQAPAKRKTKTTEVDTTRRLGRR